VNGVVGDWTIDTLYNQGLVHGLNDVAATSEIAKRRFSVNADDPLGWSRICGKTHAFKALEPSYHKAVDLRIGETRLQFNRFDGPQVDEARFIRRALEDRIELGPAVSLHLTFENFAYFGLGPELHRQAILRSGANTAADVISADHQIAAVLYLDADQKMHVWIVSIVVVNRNPIELVPRSRTMSATSSRAKALRSVISAASSGLTINRKWCQSSRQTLREGPFVREIGLSGEHARRFAGPGYAIALEIANVR
jgi:hypothetical protein